MTSQSVLHGERFARIECFRVSLETPLQIIRVHALRPSISHFLFQTMTRKLQPGLIEESTELVHAGHPDQDRRSIRHDPET